MKMVFTVLLLPLLSLLGGLLASYVFKVQKLLATKRFLAHNHLFVNNFGLKFFTYKKGHIVLWPKNVRLLHVLWKIILIFLIKMVI